MCSDLWLDQIFLEAWCCAQCTGYCNLHMGNFYTFFCKKLSYHHNSCKGSKSSTHDECKYTKLTCLLCLKLQKSLYYFYLHHRYLSKLQHPFLLESRKNTLALHYGNTLFSHRKLLENFFSHSEIINISYNYLII